MAWPFKRTCQRKRTRTFRKTNSKKADNILDPWEWRTISKSPFKSVFLNKKISNASVMLILKMTEEIFFRLYPPKI